MRRFAKFALNWLIFFTFPFWLPVVMIVLGYYEFLSNFKSWATGHNHIM